MERVADFLNELDVDVITYTDTVSTSQGENLDRIVAFHNSQGKHELDCSLHFNAYQITETKKMGCECLFVTQEDLSADVAAALAHATGLPNRGAKYRRDLAFVS